jgi:hypothetical protein
MCTLITFRAGGGDDSGTTASGTALETTLETTLETAVIRRRGRSMFFGERFLEQSVPTPSEAIRFSPPPSLKTRHEGKKPAGFTR